MAEQYEPAALGADLGRIINELRESILAYQASGYGELGAIHRMDITLKAVVTREIGGGLKIRIPFTDRKVGLDGKLDSAETQTISLTVVPAERLETFAAKDFSESLVRALLEIERGLSEGINTEPRLLMKSGSVELQFVVGREGSIELVAKGEGRSESTHAIKVYFGEPPKD